MSLFHTIFAFGNGREVANLGFVFPECLRHAFALSSLPEAKKGRRLAQGNAAQPRHKQEFFDIFAYWFRPIVMTDLGLVMFKVYCLTFNDVSDLIINTLTKHIVTPYF